MWENEINKKEKYVREKSFILIKFMWKNLFIDILKQLIIMRINYNNFVTGFY